MATLVGTQASLPDMLQSLLELEYDAIAAYTAALDRLQESLVMVRFEEFRRDHERHTRELTDFLLRLGVDPPQHADLKAIVTQGKVVLGNLAGPRGVLLAMRSNEDDTNIAWERAVARTDLGHELKAVLERGLADERRHRGWIDDALAQLDAQLAQLPASEEYVGSG